MKKITSFVKNLWVKTNGFKTIVGIVGIVVCKAEPALVTQVCSIVPILTPDVVLNFFLALAGIGVADKVQRIIKIGENLIPHAKAIADGAQGIKTVIKEKDVNPQ